MNNLEFLKKGFEEKKEEVKKASIETIKKLDMMINSQEEGKITLLIADVVVPAQEVHNMKDRVQAIIDMEITLDNIPNLEGVNANLIDEFCLYEKLLDDLQFIKYDIDDEKVNSLLEEDDDFSDIEFIELDELD